MASHKWGHKMLEIYFSAPRMLGHLRRGPSGPYMDGFAALLKRDGYSFDTAVRYLRAAAHLGHFVLEQGGTLAEINLSAFGEHLQTCRCPRSKGGRGNHHTPFGAKHFRDFLRTIGVCQFENATPEVRRRNHNSQPASNNGCVSIAAPPIPPSSSTLVTRPA